MLVQNRKKTVIILGLLVIMIIAIGVTRNPKKEPVDERTHASSIALT
jgi:hypothetical protein